MASGIISRNALHKAIFAVSAVIFAALLGRVGSTSELPFVAIALVAFVALGIAFTRGTEGLYLIIFAILFSPELGTGVATGGKATGEGAGGIYLRLEDVIMLAVGLGWMLRSAYTGRHSGVLHTRVNGAIWAYMAASIISTLLGLLLGTVRSLPAGIIHNLKYFQYFALFFLILAHIRRRETVVRMLWAMIAAFVMVLIYAYMQLGTGQRISAPFDKEPNTFGGYMVLLMCVIGGIALHDSRFKIRALMVSILLVALPPLLFTLSRASYLALIVALFSFLMFSRHRILIGAISLSLVLAVSLGLPVLPHKVQERVAGTFERGTEYHVQIAGIDFDPSSSARIVSYRQAVDRWIGSPIFGYGVTGTHFIDGQYPRLLVETGVVGLAAFLMVILRLIGEVRSTHRTLEDPLFKGAAMGFYCGIFAMLAHAIAANSFIIIRIAEPFWLLAGLVLLMPYVEHDTDAADMITESIQHAPWRY